jgi:hypothetical protein
MRCYSGVGGEPYIISTSRYNVLGPQKILTIEFVISLVAVVGCMSQLWFAKNVNFGNLRFSDYFPYF